MLSAAVQGCRQMDESGGPSENNPEKNPASLGKIIPHSDTKIFRTGILSPFRYAKGYEWILVGASFAAAIFSGLLMPYFLITSGDMINNINMSADTTETVIRMVVAGALSLIFNWIASSLMEAIGDRLTARVREHYCRSVVTQSMGWFDCNDAAGLSARLDTNLTTFRNGIGMKLSLVLCQVTIMISSLGVAVSKDWKVSLLTCIGLIPCMVFGSLLGWTAQRTERRVSEPLAMAGSAAEEAFSNIRTVVAFGAEEHINSRYAKRIGEAEREGVIGGWMVGCSVGAMLLSVFLMFSLALWLSGHAAADSLERLFASYPPSEFGKPLDQWPKADFTGGDGWLIALALLTAAFAFGNVAENSTLYMKSVEVARSLHVVCDLKSEIDPMSDSGEKHVPLTEDIVLENVSFAYPARKDVTILKDFSLRIPAGKTVALVGPSGCGKSTILQLVQRIYEPDSGRVCVGERDIKTLNTRWYRSRIGVVMQEPKLFSLTVEENIRLGTDRPLTSEEVQEAAKKANAHHFIELLPQKYGTECGMGGNKLSGGQKQRIAIARAIVRNPSILVLDEATSALDRKAEKVVQRTLDELVATTRSTTLIVAHRLTTIQNVDEIIVLENHGDGARIVERGTHRQLMDLHGLYFRLVDSQATNDDDPGKAVSAAKNGDGTTAIAQTDVVSDDGDDDDGDNAVSPALQESATEPLCHRPSSLQAAKSSLQAAKSSLQAAKSSLVSVRTIFRRKKEPSAGIMRATMLLSPYWVVFFSMVFLAVLSGMLFPLCGFLLSRFLSVLFSPDPEKIRADTDKWGLYLFLFSLSFFFIESLKNGFKEFLASKLASMMRTSLFTNLIHMDVGFHDHPDHSSGKLAGVLNADVTTAKIAATGNFLSLFQGLGSAVLGLVIGFINSWKLALVLLASFVLVVPATALETRAASDQMNDQKKSSPLEGDSASHVFSEAIDGIRVVSAYGLEKYFADRYKACVESQTWASIRSAIGVGFGWGFSQSTQFFIFGLALWYGGELSNAGEISALNAMETIFPIIFACSGVGMTVMYTADTGKAKQALLRYFSLLDAKSLVDTRDSSSDSKQLENFSGQIEYRKITFCYPSHPQRRVFKDLSFKMQPGESIALVGPSGCGKSTAIQLLFRYYDLVNEATVATKGSAKQQCGDSAKDMAVLADGYDIRDINVSRFRSYLGLVQQEPVLFNVSIEDNIRFSKLDATQEEIEAAAKMANAHNFISALPEGYATIAGKGGTQLSGGQKQRIAIARALLRQPRVLVLDEATSALDTESEKQVQATLDDVVSGAKRSTIIIAHRLSTIRNADKIIVLNNENGEGSEVVEVGTHEELMKIQGGVYRNLVLAANENEPN